MDRFRFLYPHLAALAVLLVAALLYGRAEVFQGMELRAHDDNMWRGAAQEAMEYEEENGTAPLWSNSMFGGMPMYLVYFKAEGNYVSPIVHQVLSLGLPRVALYLWLSMAGFYLFMVALGLRPVTAAASALAFGFTSYVAVVLGAGHFGKVLTIAYLPWFLAGVAWVFRKKYLAGAGLAGIGMSCAIMAGHYQMVYYYGAFFVSFWALIEAIKSIKAGEVRHVAIGGGVLAIAMVAALAANLNRIMPILEYQKVSTRAPSELSGAAVVDEEEQTGGLPRSYITGYSYAAGDFWALFVPNYKGPGNGALVNNEEAMKRLNPKDVRNLQGFQSQAFQQGIYLDQYWGKQDAAGGVIYVGAFVFLMALWGMFLVRSSIKWALFAGTVLTMWLSLGKNAPLLTDFFIDYFPGYNKFRAVNSIMVVPQFCLPVLFGLSLDTVLFNKERLKEKVPFLKIPQEKLGLYIGGAGVAFLLLNWLAPGLFQDLVPSSDADAIQSVAGSNTGALLDAVESARASIVRADLLRSLLIVALGAGVLFYYLKGKLKALHAGVALGLIVGVDLFLVDNRYLTEDKFEVKKPKSESMTAGAADRMINDDPDQGFRVASIAVSTFNDGTTSFFHHSIGGYHGAKIRRYQDLVERRLGGDLSVLVSRLQRAKDIREQNEAFKGLAALNMLNTKYLLYDKQAAPFMNLHRYGAAWLADSVVMVTDADAAIGEVMRREDLKRVAVVEESFSEEVGGLSFGKDSLGSAELLTWAPEEVKYKVNQSKEGLVVFSEIYYDKGWKAEIDGMPASPIRVNYVLRGLKVPAGNHEVRWYFYPETVYRSAGYSRIGSVVLWLLVIGGLLVFWRGVSVKSQE